jgi:hypothetical protein
MYACMCSLKFRPYTVDINMYIHIRILTHKCMYSYIFVYTYTPYVSPYTLDINIYITYT